MTDLSTIDFSPPDRSAPIRFSSLPWDHPTMLAPMKGITHPRFRDLMMERSGIGIVCTEFARVSAGGISARHMRGQVEKTPGVPLSVQVMGSDAEPMAEAAGWIAEAGADVVDVNLGCPVSRVVRRGAGAAMLRNLRLLFDLLSAMRSRIPGIMSAKIRAGFDESTEVVRIARTVEAAGVDFIVIHARRRADFYDGVADWSLIRKLVESLRIPVVGNGDCWYAADALRMERETGCDAVMIGRPALRNPWIFEQIADLRAGREPSRPDGRQLLAFIDDISTRYRQLFRRSDRAALGKLKQLVAYLGRAVDDQGCFRAGALRSTSTDQLLSFADSTLGALPSSSLDLDAFGELRLEHSGAV